MKRKAEKYRQLITEALEDALEYLDNSFNLLPDNQESLDLLRADFKNWQREELNRTRSYEWLDTERSSLTKRALGLLKMLEDQEYHLPSHQEKRFHHLVDQALIAYEELAGKIASENALRLAAAPVTENWIGLCIIQAQNESLRISRYKQSVISSVENMPDKINQHFQELEQLIDQLCNNKAAIVRPFHQVGEHLLQHPELGLPANESRFYALKRSAEALIPSLAFCMELSAAFRDAQLKISNALAGDEMFRINNRLGISSTGAQQLHRFQPQLKKFTALLTPTAEVVHQFSTTTMDWRQEINTLHATVQQKVFSASNLIKNLKATD